MITLLPIAQTLLRQWRIGLVAGLALGLAVQTVRVASLRSRLEVATRDLKSTRTALGDALAKLTTCATRRDQLQDAIDAQTEAVRAWKSEAARRQSAAAREIDAARAEAEEKRQVATRLLQRLGVLRTPAESCAEADRLILEGDQ